MSEINKAYEVLSDTVLKVEYDKFYKLNWFYFSIFYFKI
jgi:curved DNA-binding protein CbpA